MVAGTSRLIQSPLYRWPHGKERGAGTNHRLLTMALGDIPAKENSVGLDRRCRIRSDAL